MRNGGKANQVGLRFTGIELDPEAEIESAYFRFHAKKDAGAAGSLRIEIEDGLSAKGFGAGLGGRDYLDEAVAWEVGAWEAGKSYRSADVSELIERVIEDGGLEARDALAFRITGTGSHGGARLRVPAGLAPELVIAYDEIA